jgi:putative flippase GtrA
MIRELGARFYASRSWRFQLARYLTIGGVSAGVDLGIFVLLLAARVPILIVATASYGVGLAVHFTLNKYLNFRRHDRPIHRQASTYALVAFACWLVTLAIIKLATVGGLTPFAGKLAAIVLCAPIGFFGHRHFTFRVR